MLSSITTCSTIVGRSAALLAGITLAAGLALSATQAQAEDLIVKFDQSQLLRLPRPIAEIIIGNPAIADVSVQSGNMLVITGKSFGITNIIALDAERNVVQDQRILVRRDENKVVNVYKGQARSSFNCAPQCNIQTVPGDDPVYFQDSMKSMQAKVRSVEQAADGGLPSTAQPSQGQPNQQ